MALSRYKYIYRVSHQYCFLFKVNFTKFMIKISAKDQHICKDPCVTDLSTRLCICLIIVCCFYGLLFISEIKPLFWCFVFWIFHFLPHWFLCPKVLIKSRFQVNKSIIGIFAFFFVPLFGLLASHTGDTFLVNQSFTLLSKLSNVKKQVPISVKKRYEKLDYMMKIMTNWHFRDQPLMLQGSMMVEMSHWGKKWSPDI